MTRQTIKRTAKVCFDILIFILACFPEYAIRKWWKPFRRGFFCGDESLSYPYRESTFSVGAMALVVLIVPPLVILAVELFKHLDAYQTGSPPAQRKSISPGATNGGGNAASTNPNVGKSSGCHIGYRLLQCYKQIGYYLFGFALVLVATEIPKYAVGRLRPNFFAVCQPQMNDGSSCDDDNNQGHYITDYTCLGHNFTAKTIEDVRQSFPSGHSSILTYSMLYLSIYLQAMLSTRASKLLKHFLQFIFVMFAMYVSLSRVSDFWHHWSDVLSGIILGTITAIVVALYMTDLFSYRRRLIGTYKTPIHKTVHSTGSSTGKSNTTAALPAYTFGTMPYLHYPAHHAQYSHATYQNYGYVP